jgi:type II secretory pathway pseudopilin PulG
MSTKQFKDFISSVFSPVSHLGRKFRRFLKRISRAVRRELLSIARRAKRSGAGFVLPTVTMVMLVVVLLTLSIAFRSFERVNQARNVRVNQALLASATPALDRARAKIDYLLNSDQSTQLGGTPTELALINALKAKDKNNNDIYRLNDEDVLEVSFDLSKTPNGIIPEGDDGDPRTVSDNEVLPTAWRFPVDTDNDGVKDTYSIYGIFFRNPPLNSNGNPDRERKPLEARTPPMAATDLPPNPTCKALANSLLIGDSGWYYADGNLKKSFFVYAVNVPIPGVSKGNSGTTALEYQQDWTRQPLTNNAVVYEDDLAITPGPPLDLNGRIITNSNLFLSSYTDDRVKLFQISSPDSCFYKPENSKVVVGGNLLIGQFEGASRKKTQIHLYQGKNAKPTDNLSLAADSTNQSVTDPTGGVFNAMYNDKALATRINALIAKREADHPTVIPEEVQQGLNANQPEDTAWKNYFKKQLRKVPYAEVGLDTATGLPLPGDVSGASLSVVQSKDGEELVPGPTWVLPTGNEFAIEPTKETGTSNTGLTFQPKQLETTDPDTASNDPDKKESFFGDRIIIGNNLPAFRWLSDGNNSGFLGGNAEQAVGGTTSWNGTKNTPPRYRKSQVIALPDVGDIGRDGFWERAAAETPESPLSSVGGLRIVTGAGIYDPDETKTFLPQPLNSSGGTTYDFPNTTRTEAFPIVWPDTMPMSQPGSTLKGHLKMRATAVYHYAIKPVSADGKDQEPIACVSSYYDPSTETTATTGSNNGVVYAPPSKANRPASGVAPGNDGLLTGTPQILYDQANYVYPDGRFVNLPLRKALVKDEANRSLAERSAIDAELCALGISNEGGITLAVDASTGIPDGAIMEKSMLDARQVKAIDNNGAFGAISNNHFLNGGMTGKYDMPLEQRQPLEVRLTEIDLNALRKADITGKIDGAITGRVPKPEYLLPNSGLIYATRNDALPDRSDKSTLKAPDDSTGENQDGIDERKSDLVSPTDFLLDPTRRPNGIALINGGYLARNDGGNDGQNDTVPADFNDIAKEKGLILVSDLPVYVKADDNNWFNHHSQKEFTDADSIGFYDRKNLNPNFACRPGDPRMPGKCSPGDTWRPATILSDAVTLLSKNFRYGYRNEGDFDLRNNAAGAYLEKADETISVTEARKQHGFFHNNFVTNGLSSRIMQFNGSNLEDSDYSGSTPADALNSSYFNNSVTPIQRRGSTPEYVMEICRKLPVSACEPDDWEVGFDDEGNGFDAGEKKLKTYEIPEGVRRARLGAGTTAFMPPDRNDWRYPRRVAFLKDGELSAIFGKPIMKLGPLDNTVPTGGPSPIALGIDASNNLKWYYYRRNSVDIPDREANSLWFWTTLDTSGHPYKTADRINQSSVNRDQRLYWYPYDPAKANEKKLPQVGDFTFDDRTSELTYCDPSNGGYTGYSVYGEPKQLTDDENADKSCYTQDVKKFMDEAESLGFDKTGWNGQTDFMIDAHPTNKLTTDTADDVTDTNNDNVIVVEIPKDMATADPTAPDTTKVITIKVHASKDQIVVFRPPNNLNNQAVITIGNQSPNPPNNINQADPEDPSIVGKTSLQVKISGGIKPNNIFWALGRDLFIEKGISLQQPHVLIGSFFGSANAKFLPLGNVTLIGRIIGFIGSNNLVFGGSGGFPPPGTNIIGPTLIPEPQLVPVLQLYAPRTSPADGSTALTLTNDATNAATRQWLPKAETSEFNLIVGSNDVPPRPGENNGSLQNLPRFLENWQFNSSENNPQSQAKITGSFIQLGRSKYATAPYNAVLNRDSSFFTGANGFKPGPVEIFDDPMTTTVETLPYFDSSIFNLPNKTSGYYTNVISSGRTPFFGPPERIWGYDLGLLYQVPDLFSLRFSRPPTNTKPDEYYREVGRDDAWVKTLLCAKINGTDTKAVTSKEFVDEAFCKQNSGWQ